jgi:hypothetical protein
MAHGLSLNIPCRFIRRTSGSLTTTVNCGVYKPPKNTAMTSSSCRDSANRPSTARENRRDDPRAQFVGGILKPRLGLAPVNHCAPLLSEPTIAVSAMWRVASVRNRSHTARSGRARPDAQRETLFASAVARNVRDQRSTQNAFEVPDQVGPTVADTPADVPPAGARRPCTDDYSPRSSAGLSSQWAPWRMQQHRKE